MWREFRHLKPTPETAYCDWGYTGLQDSRRVGSNDAVHGQCFAVGSEPKRNVRRDRWNDYIVGRLHRPCCDYRYSRHCDGHKHHEYVEVGHIQFHSCSSYTSASAATASSSTTSSAPTDGPGKSR